MAWWWFYRCDEGVGLVGVGERERAISGCATCLEPERIVLWIVLEMRRELGRSGGAGFCENK